MAKLVTSIVVLAILLVALLASFSDASVVAHGKLKVTFSKYVNKTANGIAKPPAKVGVSDTWSSSSGSASGSASGSGSSSYAFLLFALQKCDNSSPWTIHGLWPSDSSSEGPQNCGGSSFDPNAISSLRSQISQDWPSCSWSHTSEDDFLAHEWTKHGTCTGWSELTYFQQTLSLYQQGSWKQYCDDSQSECKVQVNLH